MRAGTCRRVAAAALATAALLTLGCGDDGSGKSEDGAVDGVPFETSVDITRDGYEPARTRVLVGGTITFVNRDDLLPHTAQTNSSGARDWIEEADFDTHALTHDEPYSVTFHKPGTFDYFCSFHNSMRGVVEVVVRPSDSK
jgi:plastocyanin